MTEVLDRLETLLEGAEWNIDVACGDGPGAVAAYNTAHRGLPTTLEGVRNEAKNVRRVIVAARRLIREAKHA